MYSEACLEPYQTSKMELFAKTVSMWKLLNVFLQKTSNLDVW